MPDAPCIGALRKSHAKLSGGTVEGSSGYRVPGVSIRGKFVLSRNLGYKTSGVALWLNVVLTPG